MAETVMVTTHTDLYYANQDEIEDGEVEAVTVTVRLNERERGERRQVIPRPRYWRDPGVAVASTVAEVTSKLTAILVAEEIRDD